MYIFQEMIDTERDYVKSLQYIMDVSSIFFNACFCFSHCNLTCFCFLVFCRITLQKWTSLHYCHPSKARRTFCLGILREYMISTNGKPSLLLIVFYFISSVNYVALMCFLNLSLFPCCVTNTCKCNAT